MTVGLHTFVDLYDRALATAAHLLDRAREFSADRGVDEAEMLGWRLYDDMLPLGFQLRAVIELSCSWPARVAALPIPKGASADLDIDGFREAIASARSFLAGISPEQLEGRDDVQVTANIGEGVEPTLPGSQWLSVFATTNIYFHLSTAYGILRSRGVPLGKRDLFGRGL